MLKYLTPAFLIVSILLSSCNKPKPATGKGEYDSLFLGMYFGMEKKAFYDYCWQMNKKKKFIHGPTNQNVEYRLENEPELDHPVYMRFYPFFYKDRIYQMPVTFTYEAWAPWNRPYHADSLIKKIVPMLKRWYGGEFESKVSPKLGRVYARVEGNRRITVFVKDEQFVQVVLTDIPAETLLKQEVKELAEKQN
jgi:hypothetical protein